MKTPKQPSTVDVAKAIQAMADESRRRQMAAMKRRHRPESAADPNPWQENAIRIMEDSRE